MGAGVGYDTMLYVTLSTGIGTGATYKGELTNILRRSEGGMMRFEHNGKLMVWEKFASGKAFFEEYGLYGREDDNPEHWQAWAKDVALGFTELMAMLQPNVIVIGGSMGEHIHKYHDFLQAEVNKQRGDTVDMPIIVGAKHPDTAVINGGFVACQRLLHAKT
jgi:glucokinase